MKQWTALCKTCNWAGVRCGEEINPKQDKSNHLKHHPEHIVNIFVTGFVAREEGLDFSSASLYDMKKYPNLLIKVKD